MNKLRLAQIGFALALVASNWFSDKSYDRAVGLQESAFAPAVLGVIFAAGAAWFLGRRSYQMAGRHRGPAGATSAGIGRRALAYWPTLFLTPLLFHFETSSLTVLPDGTRVSHAFGYGTDLTFPLLILGAISIIFFQQVAEMESQLRAGDQRAERRPGSIPAPGSA